MRGSSSGLVSLAVDEPEGDPQPGRGTINSPKTYLHVSPYPEQHVRSYADTSAPAHQCTDDRTTRRNGTRDKLVTTAAGDLTVKIPKLRSGSFFPALLAPRRRIDIALHTVVMQAYVEGVSTRRVDDLVIAMGGTGISIRGCRACRPRSAKVRKQNPAYGPVRPTSTRARTGRKPTSPLARALPGPFLLPSGGKPADS